jgi:hypothetical protein
MIRGGHKQRIWTALQLLHNTVMPYYAYAIIRGAETTKSISTIMNSALPSKTVLDSVRRTLQVRLLPRDQFMPTNHLLTTARLLSEVSV